MTVIYSKWSDLVVLARTLDLRFRVFADSAYATLVSEHTKILVVCDTIFALALPPEAFTFRQRVPIGLLTITAVCKQAISFSARDIELATFFERVALFAVLHGRIAVITERHALAIETRSLAPDDELGPAVLAAISPDTAALVNEARVAEVLKPSAVT
jgi:hypothetical protein